MYKRWMLATLAVFVTWSALEFVIHGVLLRSSYAATAELWRPEAEMKMGLLRVVSLLSAAAFCFIYGQLIGPRTLRAALAFGALWGLAHGLGAGYGTYAVMPVPYSLALSWFLGMTVQALAGGLVAGLILRDRPAPASPGA